ncbi:FAST kinase domain-containing protein 1, mitochondrial isoform X1 [Pteropus alecto]|uniref:FAST kinase domain-containing protein 1, mitochondrial isoform X1 n=1 Tax=Pteropus alecto TaxID=9402 RepID=UPI000D5343B6|nr:FAST kinase domain-containing protein 1, mitochondrial isoform X1 [Pteropus alecto]XP_015452051.2 FAST kinase domain-containing protein 1, mitochondrial isoform X1 [Pteropus alecto]XP_015452053.2 FAST kinase domain-containing protein 1, mitochondrial isoform X1 [Pteropus alecto]XP_015452054.2 FAST kinase domain-containing protein 1, mitochondrial isoform X1 [Pteropus alecto]XP_015452055.2 FAST kinase domain-containing protein 1, mitochondrial isoform X1 [Pteropus alecto]XP_015452056.2 FAST 
MFRLRAICPFSWRVFHFRPFSCETLIRQMDKCTDEEQVFDLIEKNKAIFSEKQVGYAFNILWQFQKQKTSLFKSVECIRDHPQFLTLYNLTTNKMEFMNDDNLVNVLYITQHFAVEAHDPLVEALVTEAWRRLERFDINVLSKFSSCLADQHLNFSPLMGKIADIVNRKLETIQDLRSLSVLMVSISSLISQRFQDQLVNKTELLFDTIDSSQVNIARRIVQFLRNIKYSYYPLLERCNKVFLSHVNHLDLESISKILSLYHFLQFHSFEFVLMAKKRLTEMIPQFDHPASFVKLFVALGPMAGPEEKKQLESTILLMSEELTSQQALAVMGAMEEMESRNSRLIKKIASILHKHLDDYKPVELLKITKALIFLHFQSKELFVKLKELLHSYLKISVKPSEISSLVCAISMLPSPHLDEVGISRIEAVLPQCDLNDLNGFATSILRWIQYDCMHLDSTGKQLKLLQKLDHYGHQSLQKCNNLNLLWEELKSLKGDWFAQSLLEETIATLQRLVDEINYMNVAGIASFISRTNYLSTLLLDRIASVVLQQIEKIHPFSVLAIILPFSILNYDPPQRNEFFGTCIQHLNSYLTLLDPLMLVFLGFSLATLEYFPEDLLKTIFNIKFLDRLDSQLELLCSSLNRRVQFRLMELNRAVCLECPEYQIPWFHDRFCQHYNKDIGSMNGAQQQISKMLAEILGGINCVKASVLTPYYHMIDFECILDKRKKPLPYGSHNITLGKLPEMHWESNTQIVGSRLPPGAERIALEFLDLRAFCTNIPHLKGKSAMKKRHLEILGYRVIQIPHFEWNSMALSTKDARMDYLRERIFGEDKKYSRK